MPFEALLSVVGLAQYHIQRSFNELYLL